MAADGLPTPAPFETTEELPLVVPEVLAEVPVTVEPPKDMDETEDRDDWRLDSDGWVGGPSGRQASTEALIWLTSAAASLAATSSLGRILILMRRMGASKSSESESELELLLIVAS